MLELYLIRHAESELNNYYNSFIGGRSNNSPLTDKGKTQAMILGKRLVKEAVYFDEVYSSAAERARHTAIITCKEIGFPIDKIVFSEDLLELSQGDWEGRPRDKIYTAEMLKIIDSDNWNFKAPNGESQKEVEERLYSWLEKNLLFHNGDGNKKAGVFGHGTAFKCLLRKVMDFSPSITYKIALYNTSITQLIYDKKGLNVIRINDAGHIRLLED